MLSDENARLALRVAGQLPEAAAIPRARLGLLAGLDERAGGFFESPLDAALRELGDASLLEELHGKQLRLHPLVREYAAGQTPPGEVPSFRCECAARLADAWDDLDRLETACASRGVDALQEDLLSALALIETERSNVSLASPPGQATFQRSNVCCLRLRPPSPTAAGAAA